MIKKVAALAAAVGLAFTLSACGGTGEKLPTLSFPETASSAVSGAEGSTNSRVETADTDFEDTLEGLCQYLEKNYVVTGEKTEMSYKEIGAVGGYRYKFVYGGSTVQAEFYEFDLENLEEKGKSCLDSVKTQGKFTVLDNEVPAILSDNGKYLMIYTDPSSEAANATQRETAEKLFRKFKA